MDRNTGIWKEEKEKKDRASRDKINLRRRQKRLGAKQMKEEINGYKGGEKEK